MNFLLTLSLATVALLSSRAASAATLSSQIRHALCPFHRGAASRLLSAEILEESTEAEILELLDLGKKYGPCTRVTEERDGRFLFEFRDARVEAELRFNRKNRLEDFNFSEAQFLDDDFAKLEAFVRAGGGHSGFWMDKNGAKVLGIDEEQSLNISRAFHLYALKALAEAVKARKAKLTDLVTLEGKARTVSFGLLHHWAPGTAISLDTLKNLVAVENDATALDLLVGALGKERVEKQGAHLAPLLTYREMARLSESIQAGHAPANREEAAKLLAALTDADGIVDFPDERFDLVSTVGWFGAARELCAVVRALRDEPALAHAYRDLRDQENRKPGETVELLVDARDPGVGQTTILFRHGADEYCVSYTLNSETPLDERRMNDVIGRAESLLLKASLPDKEAK